MELNHLKYFYEVARAGSFTAAAKSLRVSQPSLSKTVALLEEREGIKLLERSKSGVELTEVGLKVYEQCCQIFEIVNSVEIICKQRIDVPQGPLNFGASDHISNYLLLESISNLKKQFPKVYPSIYVATPTDVVQRLAQGKIEFGIFFSKIATPNITYEHIRDIPLCVVASPEYLKRKKDAESYEYIGSRKVDFMKRPAQKILKKVSSKLDFTLETNNQEFQKRLCMQGLGVVVMTDFMVKEELEKGLLVEVPMEDKVTAKLFLAKRSSHQLSLNAREFLKLIPS